MNAATGRALLPLTLVAVWVAGCGGGSTQGDGRPDYELRSLYCAYESRTKAELPQCIRLITAKQIIGSTTPAARFAKSFGSRECGAGAGPLCAEKKREAEGR